MPTIRSYISIIGLLIVSTLVVSCDGGDDATPTSTPTPTPTPTPTSTPTPTPTPTNVDPTAAAGTDQTMTSDAAVTLTGTGSDSDGTIASYVWSQEGGTGLTLSNANTATATFTAPVVTTVTSYTLKLTVTDNDGASGSDELVVTVNPAPIASLTPTLTAISGNEQITLNWASVTDATSYTLCHATQSLGTPADLANCSAFTSGTLVPSLTGTSHTVTSLTNGTAYYLALIAVDVNGNQSQPSVQVSATPTMPINDTGITWGGNYPNGNNADCTGETIAQQDCSHGRDAKAAAGNLVKIGAGTAGFDFTKLDANGVALTDQSQTYTTAPWACVKDNHTGLIWEVKTAAAGGAGLHDKADKYNWYNTNNSTNGGAVGYEDDDGAICEGYINDQPSTYCNTQAFTARVNAVGLCGAADWGLPNITELKGIVNKGTVNPSIDALYYPNTASTNYWSSSPDASNSDGAWIISFSDGYVTVNSRNTYNRVRLVRSGQ